MADVSVTPPLRNVIEGIIAADRVSRRSLPAVDVADAILAIPEISAGLAALRIARTGPGIAITFNGDAWGDQAFAAATARGRYAYRETPSAAVLALADAIEEDK